MSGKKPSAATAKDMRLKGRGSKPGPKAPVSGKKKGC